MPASEQRELNFEQREAKPDTLNHRVHRILARGGWWMPHELRDAILHEDKIMASDSSITARLRDLRKTPYGRHNIEKRRREGSNAYEYRLAD